MKIFSRLIILYVSAILLFSCGASGYITDPVSIKRQKEMRNYRTGINLADIGLLVASSIGALFSGAEINTDPESQSFKKMRLINGSKDTLFVNMVTDWHWRDSSYCDIRDIVMPPFRKTRIIVPLGANYNVFFRNEFNAPDDEKVEINTSQINKVKLKPQKEGTDLSVTNKKN